MNPSDRKLEQRAGRLLRAGSPPYPDDMDRLLRERLAGAGREKRPARLGLARPWRGLAASLSAAALLVTAGLAWWLAHRQSPPVQVSPAPPAAAVRPARPLPAPPAAAAASLNLPSRPEAGGRAVRRPSGRRAVPGEPLRLEFAIPDKEITILWEQRSEFDLAALLAAR